MPVGPASASTLPLMKAACAESRRWWRPSLRAASPAQVAVLEDEHDPGWYRRGSTRDGLPRVGPLQATAQDAAADAPGAGPRPVSVVDAEKLGRPSTLPPPFF
jgi:hypothetical protein